MKSIILATITTLTAISLAHAAEVGKQAPAFEGKTLTGESISLSDYKGKVVVLEWTNFDCPFVKKHYSGSANMTKLQEKYAAQDVVWITVCSSAEGQQGHSPPEAQAKRATKEGNKARHFIDDSSGVIGKAYGAAVTPHMFVICREGNLVYQGAIDSMATTDVNDIKNAEPLLANAIDATLTGQPVRNATNRPYGCGVKYSK